MHSFEYFMRGSRKNGFSIIELIAVLVLSGFVITTILLSFHPMVKSASLMKAAHDATVLAEDMMNEIRSKNFVDPENPMSFGPEEASRSMYDDVDDYDHLTNSPPQTIEGIVMTNYGGFKVSVAVENVLPDDFNAAVAQPNGSTGFKRIRIVVSNGQVGITNVSVVSEYD